MVRSLPVTIWPGLLRRLLAARSLYLGGEIGFLPFDSLAQSITHKSGDLHSGADFALSFLQGLGNRLALFVVDEGLVHQADFLVELFRPDSTIFSIMFSAVPCWRYLSASTSLSRCTTAGSSEAESSACGLAAATCMASWRPRCASSSALPSDSRATITPILPAPSITALWM